MAKKFERNSSGDECAPAPVQESSDSPRQLNASEDTSALGTNAGGRPVSGKPKKD